ncbi:MAG: hypothetical protein KF777_01465 [Planctomycetaceae bacterium]|nr:hypothetical protein [Planctomycetaceae bacterium]
MSAVPVALADAIVADLNGAAFSLALTAERGYVLPVKLEGSTTLKAWVMPAEIESEAVDQETDGELHQVHVALVQKVANFANATIDPLIQLGEEIRDSFRNRSWLTEELDAFVEKRDSKLLYDPERLRAKHQFLSVITLTCRANREVG